MLIDAHTHLTPQQVRHKDLLPKDMLLLVNTATAQEAQWLFGMREPRFVPTVGLHPWEAGRHGLEELAPFWERCAAIGEIGLDSVWCGVPCRPAGGGVLPSARPCAKASKAGDFACQGL